MATVPHFSSSSERPENNLSAIGRDLIQMMNRRMDARRDGRVCTGLESGIDAIDLTMDGLHDGEICVLAAAPGTGKTTLALNIALHAMVTESKPVIFTSLEMDPKYLLMQLVAMQKNASGAPKNDITAQMYFGHNGQYREQAAREILEFAHKYEHQLIFANPEDLVNLPRHMAFLASMNGGGWGDATGLLVLDYLQLYTELTSDPDDRRDFRRQVDAAFRHIRTMTKESGFATLLMSSLSRASGYEFEKTGLSQLKESGGIEYNAPSVLLLGPLDESEAEAGIPKPWRRLMLKSLKNRMGPTVNAQLIHQIASGEIYEVHAGDPIREVASVNAIDPTGYSKFQKGWGSK